MGFFSKLFSARRTVFRAMEEQENRLRALSALPDGELTEQEDETLCEVLAFRIDQAVNAHFGEPHKRRMTLADCYAAFSDARRGWAIADLFASIMDSEVEGLYVVLEPNELGRYVWELPGILRTLGADAHADLLEAFFRKNGIDPTDMDAFWARDPAEQPFERFNRSFRALPPLSSLLAAYGRLHLSLWQEAAFR